MKKNGKLIRILLDWQMDAKHAVLWEAKESACFEEAGLRVDFLEPPSKSANSLQMVQHGEAELAINYPHNILLMRDELPSLISAGTLVAKNPQGLLSLHSARLLTPDTLRGKRIGVGPSPVSRGQFQLFCIKQRLDPEELSVVTVGFDGEDYLLRGDIDALDAVGYAIPRTRKKGYEINFLPYTRYGVPDSPFLVFAAEKKWAENAADDLKAFFSCLRKSFARVSDWKTDGWARYTSHFPGREAEEEHAVWKETRPLMITDQALFSHSLEEVEKLQRVLRDQGILEQSYSIEDIFRNDYIQV